MTLYRTTDPSYPFIWESDKQPPARWHGKGEGPAHYFATTPEGAWAELLRHEGITDPEDLKGFRERAIWVVHLNEEINTEPQLGHDTLTGDQTAYPACQEEAKRLRASGCTSIITTSAALKPGGAITYTVNGGQHEEPTESRVVILFGPRPDLTAQLVSLGRPPERLLEHVRHFTD